MKQLLISVFALCCFNVFLSQTTISVHDSLNGFDEQAAINSAISGGFFEPELAVKLSYSKRNNLNTKNYTNPPPLGTPPSTTNAPQGISNIDFEYSPGGIITTSNQIAGWTIVGGYNGFLSPGDNPAFPQGLSNATSCNLLGCCPMNPSSAEIIDCGIPGGYIDNIIGPQYPIYSQFGSSFVNSQYPDGTKVIRLNDGITGDYSITKLSRSFLIGSTDTVFSVAILPVVNPLHDCCSAGRIVVNYYIGTTLINSDIFQALSSACTPTNSCYWLICGTGNPNTPSNFNPIYMPWRKKTINLTPYTGQQMELEIITTDCNAGGHYSYAYIDAGFESVYTTTSSSYPELIINGTPFSATDSIINFVTCNSSVTISTAYDMNHWSGPNGWNLSTSTPSLSGFIPGSYTLNATKSSYCSQTDTVTQVINIIGPQEFSITSSDTTVCKGEYTTLFCSGFSGFHWSTGDTTASILIFPQANQDYTVTALDSNGCSKTKIFHQFVEACTDISERGYSNRTIVFPNPNNGVFTLLISTELESPTISVDNMLGIEILQIKLEGGQNEIKIPSACPGIYFYTILSDLKAVAKGRFAVE